MLTVGAGIFSVFLACLLFNSACVATVAFARTDCC